jgi:hypothetical protein
MTGQILNFAPSLYPLQVILKGTFSNCTLENYITNRLTVAKKLVSLKEQISIFAPRFFHLELCDFEGDFSDFSPCSSQTGVMTSKANFDQKPNVYRSKG